ncbi:hypothetical protein [Roseofilum capinflatum]|uniref:Uncharacterized protein n=1 Tax=Roseofilum capinflatum BLCC-M114 TaxID=3022440 RepID=A0ABT7B1M9_9CYAN|nr:hypothetical protein [Roseofilum capinflatum]MDJ1173069.1 hypothetical protein [Roseofilum capinflatum BLCC-M114]
MMKRSPTPPPAPNLDPEQQQEKHKVRQAAEQFAEFFQGEIMDIAEKVTLPQPESFEADSPYLESVDEEDDPPF